jgi:hypothetical protein
MLSWDLMFECTTPGGLCPGEQSAAAGHRGPQELLSSKCVPGSTDLVAHWHVRGKEQSFRGVGENAQYRAEVRAACCSSARRPSGGVCSHMRCRLSK